MYDFNLDKGNNVRHIRRSHKGYIKNKPKPTNNLKYNIEFTPNVKSAKEMYDKHGYILWKDYTEKEVYKLMDLNCFEFSHEVYNTGEGW